jgi:hypothetical protein
VAPDAGVAREWIRALQLAIRVADRGSSSAQPADSASSRATPDALFMAQGQQRTPAVVVNLVARDLTADFKALRKAVGQRPSQFPSTARSAEMERLRTRIDKLLKNDRRQYRSKDAFEQSVVTWSKDPQCCTCSKKFGFAASRQQCRLCGSVG